MQWERFVQKADCKERDRSRGDHISALSVSQHQERGFRIKWKLALVLRVRDDD